MIKDIEEESKTKFSMKVEFSVSFKVTCLSSYKILCKNVEYVIINMKRMVI